MGTCHHSIPNLRTTSLNHLDKVHSRQSSIRWPWLRTSGSSGGRLPKAYAGRFGTGSRMLSLPGIVSVLALRSKEETAFFDIRRSLLVMVCQNERRAALNLKFGWSSARKTMIREWFNRGQLVKTHAMIAKGSLPWQRGKNEPTSVVERWPELAIGAVNRGAGDGACRSSWGRASRCGLSFPK
jgi:hypothetical protein